MKINVIGMGYVGVTLAVALSEAGNIVQGVEVIPDIVSKIQHGEPTFAENGLDDRLAYVVKNRSLTCVDAADSKKIKNFGAQVHIITVGTPLRNGEIYLDAIKSASCQVKKILKDGDLVVLRSTVKVGTAASVVKPVLDESHCSYSLSVCPERSLEGNALNELFELPQIIGSDEPLAIEKSKEVFRNITNKLVVVDSLETAELIKLVDNTYRDLTFAFGNEVAAICDHWGIDAHQVIASGKLGYSRTNVAKPGLVGGPCLEKDPHILVQSSLERGYRPRIIEEARRVNETYHLEFLDKILSEVKSDEINKICLAGLAFKGKPETDDLRGTVALSIFNHIVKRIPDCMIHLFDPVCSADNLNKHFENCKIFDNLYRACRGVDILIICNNHKHFSSLSINKILEVMEADGQVLDYWGIYRHSNEANLFAKYRVLGNLK